MPPPKSESLSVEGDDRDFLVAVAKRVLGNTSVAATTASALSRRGFDARRIDRLIPRHNVTVQVGEYVLKKVEPDIETPGNFGLFVRRKAVK